MDRICNLDQTVNQTRFGMNYEKIFIRYECEKCQWIGKRAIHHGGICPICGAKARRVG